MIFRSKTKVDFCSKLMEFSEVAKWWIFVPNQCRILCNIATFIYIYMNYKGGFVPNQTMDVSSQEYKNMIWCLKMRFFKLTLWSLPPGEDKPVDGMGVLSFWQNRRIKWKGFRSSTCIGSPMSKPNDIKRKNIY